MFNLDLQLKKLLLKVPLLKSYVDWLRFVPTSSVNTGTTDGKNVYYNLENLSKRDELGQQFTLLHEILHVALDHMNRQEDRDSLAFNYACDAVINQMIKQVGIPIPEGSIDCPEASNYTAEEYYDLIRSRDDFDELMNSLASQPERQEVITTHDYWKKDKQLDTSDKPTDVPKNEKEFQYENEKICQKMDDEFYDKINKSSNNSTYDEKNIQLSNVGSSTAFISWEDLLKYKLQKNKSEYDFFNGEFDEGGLWYYPYQNINADNEAEVEILIDSSYSVSEDLVKMFLREVKSIVGNAKIRIACFNTKVDEFVDINDETDIDNFVITSQGGTDFEVAVKGFQSPTSTKIVFTDGGAVNPTSFCEAIWIVYGTNKIEPPGGFVYNVDEKDFKKNTIRK